MGIPTPGQSLAPGLSTYSNDILKIELSGPSKQHLSIIDVPGIFGTPTYGVTTKEDMTLVQRISWHMEVVSVGHCVNMD